MSGPGGTFTATAWRRRSRFAICAPVVSPTPESGRQPEKLQQPPARHLLDHRGGRRGDGVEGVLVPGRGEPVGRQRRGQRAAGHEPEVARAGRGDEARGGVACECLDHVCRRNALTSQLAAERRAQLGEARERAGVALADGVEVVRRELGGTGEEGAVDHARNASLLGRGKRANVNGGWVGVGSEPHARCTNITSMVREPSCLRHWGASGHSWLPFAARAGGRTSEAEPAGGDSSAIAPPAKAAVTSRFSCLEESRVPRLA